MHYLSILLLSLSALVHSHALAHSNTGHNPLLQDPRQKPVDNSCLFIGPLSGELALQIEHSLYLNGVRSQFVRTLREQLVMEQELFYRVEIESYSPVEVVNFLAELETEAVLDPYIIQPAAEGVPGLIGVGSYSVIEPADKLRQQLQSMGIRSRIQEFQVPIAGNEVPSNIEKLYLKLDSKNYSRFQHRIDSDLFFALYRQEDHVTITDKMRVFVSEICHLG